MVNNCHLTTFLDKSMPYMPAGGTTLQLFNFIIVLYYASGHLRCGLLNVLKYILYTATGH